MGQVGRDLPWGLALRTQGCNVEMSHRGEMGQSLFIPNPKEFGLEPAEAPSLSNVLCPALWNNSPAGRVVPDSVMLVSWRLLCSRRPGS